MELFYNPERMSETEIKETFVAYQWLVDEIVSILKRQPKGAGIQHIVIVAPRGMGKTTLLLMLRFAALNTEIAKRWQPVLFPEESYGVYDLADLWVDFLNHVASETGDSGLRDEVSQLKVSHPESDDLEAVALAKIKDWRKKNKKRFLMLLDNFDMILEQIGNEKDNASLRDVLMNDDTLMLVGGSTTFFKEARAYDQPLYNLFKIYNLDGLDSEQIEELLRRRAKLDGVENFEEILRANRTRLRVLEYFTGGNPRLVLMLYRVITHSQISDVRRGLEKLLDEVTPYYKAKIESLPPQQRKILDQIARITGQTREGLTPTEIAPATRLPVNHVSAQLKRLADLGYVRMANIPGRSSYYTLSEPLYAIWHQMRFSRETRKRLNWLIDFLKGWYEANELGTECQRLEVIFRSYLSAGLEREARDVLEHRRYLMEAIEDRQSRASTFESIIRSYLELSDVDALKEEILSGHGDISLISDETRQRLEAVGLLTNIGGAAAWRLRGIALLKDSKFEEAVGAFRRAIEIDPNFESWHLLAKALRDMDRHQEALVSFEEALKFQPASFEALIGCCSSLLSINRREDVIFPLDKALAVRPDSALGWYARGLLLYQTGSIEEALKSFDRCIALEPSSHDFLWGKAVALYKANKKDEALRFIDDTLKLYPKSSDAHLVRSMLLISTDRDDALMSFKRALDPKSNSHRRMVNTTEARFFHTMLSIMVGDFDQVRVDWKEFVSHPTEPENKTRFVKNASDLVTLLAKAGQWKLAKDLITSSNLEEPLFPLASALDYLLKDGETSIEKLSPEIRRIVDEIISTLKNSSVDDGKSKRVVNLASSSLRGKSKKKKKRYP